MKTRYTWDPRKNEANMRKHGLRFEMAVKAFDGPTTDYADTRFEYGEERWITIGLYDGAEITVTHTDRPGGERRIISAWRSTKQERQRFWRDIGGHDR